MPHATVVAFDDPNGGKYIAAYVVSDSTVDINALNDFIFDCSSYRVAVFDMDTYSIAENFPYTVQKPTMHRARLISEEIVRAFLDRELDEVRIFYTEMQSAVAMEPVNMQLLPLKKAEFPVSYTHLTLPTN